MATLKHFVVLAACATLASCSPDALKGTAQSGSSSSSAEQPTAFIRQPVMVKDLEVKLVNVTPWRNYPGASKTAVAIIVYWEMTNKGSRPLQVDQVPTLTLVDDKGVVYRPDAALTSAIQITMEAPATRKTISDLSPDLSQTDLTVFEVSTTKFDNSTWHIAAGDTRFNLCSLEKSNQGRCAKVDILELLNKQEAQ